MSESKRKVRITFRFLELDEDRALELARIFMPKLVTLSRPNSSGKRAVHIKLENQEICEKVAAYVKSGGFRSEAYGLYSSIVTNRDHDGIRLPPHATELIRRLGGYVDFAFIHA
jgi:hypothetical protein